MNIQIHGLRNFSEKQQNKIKSALYRGGPVIDSSIFEKKIVNAKYKESRGLNGDQILRLIRSGADDKGKTIDGDIDVDMEGFWSASNTIGSTYVGGFTAYMNRRYLDKFDESEVFGHVMHELMHRAYGFKHKSKIKSIKLNTVPYVVGYKSTAAFEEFYAQAPINELTGSSFVSNNLWNITFVD